MESLVDSGKIRAIGVSNFRIDQLERLLSYARIKPACNQVESHPWLPQPELFDFCKRNNITFMAYSPLGSQSGPGAMHTIDRYLMEDDSIVGAANRLGVQPAQILLAWAGRSCFSSLPRIRALYASFIIPNTVLVQRGSVPLPKSASPDRIRNNFSCKNVFLPLPLLMSLCNRYSISTCLEN